MSDRAVRNTGKDRDGDITRLCALAKWPNRQWCKREVSTHRQR